MNKRALIVGAGVCGLWLARTLQARGFDCEVWDSRKDASQSRASQGILHSGLKYQFGDAAQANSMPALVARWQAALQGEGEIDLSAVRVHTRQQYFFTGKGIANSGLAMLSQGLMRSGVQRLRREQWPELLRPGSGQVLLADEWVLDPNSLLGALAGGLLSAVRERALQACELVRESSGRYRLAGLSDSQQPDLTLLCAGSGNGSLQSKFAQQLRPLAMVHARHPGLPAFFGHCLGFSNKPRLTISSPTAGHWYLGGELAEQGSQMDDAELAQRSRELLQELFPQLAWRTVEINIQRIDRAEPQQRQAALPDSAWVDNDGNLFTCWPSKLVRAPEVADKVLEKLGAARLAAPA